MESAVKLPEEFSLRMSRQVKDAAGFFESLRHESPTSIRLNPGKRYSCDGETVLWCNSGKYLEARPVFTLDPAFHAGAYYVQEASSMFLEQVFTQLGLTEPRIRILDLCAAPGGKSTHIISLLHPESLLVSNEVIRQRASILQENLSKWGYDNCVVTNNDPQDFKRLEGFFDVILVDAPCSGEGLFRKDIQARAEWSEQNAYHCSIRQRRILNDIWPSLKGGGLLIYCTCTYNPDENEENMQWLSEQHEVESISLKVKDTWGIDKISYRNITGYSFHPHQVKGEGFFLSVVRKEKIQHETRMKGKQESNRIPKHIVKELADWLMNPESMTFHIHNESIYVLNEKLYEAMTVVRNHLRIVSMGTPVGERKGSKLIPSAELALSVHLNRKNFHTLELSLDNALTFLKKENVKLTEFRKGYTLVTYNSLPLGWLNVLENRANNLFPKAWRIRMNI